MNDKYVTVLLTIISTRDYEDNECGWIREVPFRDKFNNVCDDVTNCVDSDYFKTALGLNDYERVIGARYIGNVVDMEQVYG